MRRMGLMGIAAMAMAAGGMMPVAMTKEQGIAPAQQIVSRKSKKAMKRMKFAESSGSYLSRNAPPKRKLHRNMVRHGRRVRRKHRRAA